MMMYGNDNRDYLPPANWGATAGSPPGWLYTVLNGSVPDPGPGGNYATNPIAAFATGLLFPYTRDPRTYLCPVDIQSKTYTATAAGAHRAGRLSSYILNGSVCGFGFSPSVLSCKVTDAWNPGCYLLWGPDEYANGPSNPGIFAFNDGANFPSTSEGSIERLHSITGGLILTVGGSVPFVSVQKFTKESTTAAKNLAYWSPFSSNGH